MKISTKGRYALQLMLDIALQPSNRPVALKDVSKRQNISFKYLEQIMPALTGAGLIRSVRGPKGGYYINKSLDAITVGDILRLTEGSLAPVDQVDTDIHNTTSDDLDTIDIMVWQKLYKAICGVVDHVTIQDLVDQERSNGGEYYL